MTCLQHGRMSYNDKNQMSGHFQFLLASHVSMTCCQISVMIMTIFVASPSRIVRQNSQNNSLIPLYEFAVTNSEFSNSPVILIPKWKNNEVPGKDVHYKCKKALQCNSSPLLPFGFPQSWQKIMFWFCHFSSQNHFRQTSQPLMHWKNPKKMADKIFPMMCSSDRHSGQISLPHKNVGNGW